MADGLVIDIPQPQGELTINKKVHGGFINVLVKPYSAPDEWFFKQFPDMEAIEEYAFVNHLIIKRDQ